MPQHFVSNKESCADPLTEVDESKIFFCDLCINFFRVGKAGRIVQDVDGKIRESPLHFTYKIFFGKIQSGGKYLPLIRVYHGGDNNTDSQKLLFFNLSEYGLLYVIPAQRNVSIR